jgi:hypothetical protein
LVVISLSLESVRKQLESEYFRFSDDLWAKVAEHCAYEDDDEESFVDSARQVLGIIAAAIDTTASTERLPAKPGRKSGWSGHYSPQFSKRYDLYCFVARERSRGIFAELMDEDPQPPPTWAELFERYSGSCSLRTGEPSIYRPKSVAAFKKAYQRAESEFGDLTEEDSVDWSAQMLLDAFLEVRGSWKRPRTLSDSFQIIRDKRAGKTKSVIEVRDFVQHLADAYAPETERVAERQPVLEDTEPDLRLNEDASFEEIMLAMGEREGWPSLQYRLAFTIGAGEESWRQYISQAPQQDRDVIVADHAEYVRYCESKRKLARRPKNRMQESTRF